MSSRSGGCAPSTLPTRARSQSALALRVSLTSATAASHVELERLGVHAFDPVVRAKLATPNAARFRTIRLGQTQYFDDPPPPSARVVLVLDVWSSEPSSLEAQLVGKATLPLDDQLPPAVDLELLIGVLRCEIERGLSADESVSAAAAAPTVAATPPRAPVALAAAKAAAAEMSDEEKASFRFCGQRARPRKKIEAAPLVGQTYLKPPGSCKSRWPEVEVNVEVECCERCDIYILDVAAQVQVSDCRDCRIVIGPCAGSVFLMDCVGCTISVAARQIRLRDVTDCELRTHTPMPEAFIVESSRRLRVSPFDVEYEGIATQWELAGFSGAPNDNWRRIFDFSADANPGSKVWEEVADVKPSRLFVSREGLCRGKVVEQAIGANELDFDDYEHDDSPPKVMRLESTGGSSGWGLSNYDHEEDLGVEEDIEELVESDSGEDDMGC